MSRRNMIITGMCLSLVLFITIGLYKLIAIEKEKIETERRIHFEQRASEIKSDAEKRMEQMKKNWQRDRQQVIHEGLKLITVNNPAGNEMARNQIAQWLKNVDGNYQLAEINLVIEEARKIAELRREIWDE